MMTSSQSTNHTGITLPGMLKGGPVKGNLKAAHTPYLPAKRFESLYAGAKYVPPPSADEDLSGKPVLRRAVEPADWAALEGVAPEPPESRRGRGADRDSVVRDQLRTLAAVDEGVG